MRVQLERGNVKLIFGRSMILSRIEADPLDYEGDFPTYSRADMLPKVRYIELEGYIVSTASSHGNAATDVEHRRRDLARLISPGNGFLIRIGDKYANLVNGKLTYRREAPFSGERAEHFILRAVISGGFFHRSTTTVTLMQSAEGIHLPGCVTDPSAVGVLGGECLAEVNNAGDVPVGFSAEFSVSYPTSRFVLTNTDTHQYLSCNYSFKAGDRIIVSTHRDDLRFAVRRNGTDTNLTGYADEGAQLFLLPPREFSLTVGEGVLRGNVTFTDSYITF